jgi:FkbM family methyltransferase
MKLEILNKLNAIACARRDLTDPSVAAPSQAERRRLFPYHGFVEIDLPGCPLFLMFCANDDVVALEWFWTGRFEPASLSLWCELAAKAPPVILDIGAYTGIYGLSAAILSKRSRVLAIEPVDRIHARVLVNRSINGLTNLTVHRAAAGRKAGTITINLHSGNATLPTGSSIVDGSGRETVETQEIKMLAIDSLPEASAARVGLMKIDAERAEIEVLAGMRSTIERWSPDILVELLGPTEIDTFSNALPSRYRLLAVCEETGTLLPPGEAQGLNFLATARPEGDLAVIRSGMAERFRSIGRKA